jgi:hypothetical protein
MKVIIILVISFTLPSICLGQSPDTTKVVGGLVRDCEEKINLYLTPTAPDAQKPVDLTKYKQFDLTTNYLRPDWNQWSQGQQGTCTAFAVAFAISIQRNIYNDFVNKQRTLLQYSPSFVFNVAKGNYRDPFRYNCRAGISFIDAYLVVKEKGIARIETCPYSTISDGCRRENYPKANALKEAQSIVIGNFQRPKVGVDVFKTILVSPLYHPICIGVYLSSTYDTAAKPENLGAWQSAGVVDQTRAHAMLIVGFEDNKFGKGKGAFKVLDWQGNAHGDKGVIWMSYDLLRDNQIVFDAYIVSHAEEYVDPTTGTVAGDSGAGSIDSTSSAKVSFWLKQGYFTEKGPFHIFAKAVNKRTNRTIFRITDADTDELIRDDLYLSLNSTANANACLNYKGEFYQLRLVEVDKRGNPFNLANPYAAVMKLQRIDSSECESK